MRYHNSGSDSTSASIPDAEKGFFPKEAGCETIWGSATAFLNPLEPRTHCRPSMLGPTPAAALDFGQGRQRHVRQRPVRRQENPRHRRRHGAGQGDGGAVSRARRRDRDLRSAQGGLRRDGGRIDEGAWRARLELRRRHPRRRGGRCDGRGDFSRFPADRPRQQRRRQLHFPHRGLVAARVRRDRQYRHARDLLRDPSGRQALDRGQAQGQRGFDCGHLGAQRRARS